MRVVTTGGGKDGEKRQRCDDTSPSLPSRALIVATRRRRSRSARSLLGSMRDQRGAVRADTGHPRPLRWRAMPGERRPDQRRPNQRNFSFRDKRVAATRRSLPMAASWPLSHCALEQDRSGSTRSIRSKRSCCPAPMGLRIHFGRRTSGPLRSSRVGRINEALVSFLFNVLPRPMVTDPLRLKG